MELNTLNRIAEIQPADKKKFFIREKIVQDQDEKESREAISAPKRHRYLTGLIMFLILLAIIPVAIYEFCKGWIQHFIGHSKKSYPSESLSG